jgi:hypothetical protein
VQPIWLHLFFYRRRFLAQLDGGPELVAAQDEQRHEGLEKYTSYWPSEYVLTKKGNERQHPDDPIPLLRKGNVRIFASWKTLSDLVKIIETLSKYKDLSVTIGYSRIPAGYSRIPAPESTKANFDSWREGTTAYEDWFKKDKALCGGLDESPCIFEAIMDDPNIINFEFLRLLFPNKKDEIMKRCEARLEEDQRTAEATIDKWQKGKLKTADLDAQVSASGMARSWYARQVEYELTRNGENRKNGEMLIPLIAYNDVRIDAAWTALDDLVKIIEKLSKIDDLSQISLREGTEACGDAYFKRVPVDLTPYYPSESDLLLCGDLDASTHFFDAVMANSSITNFDFLRRLFPHNLEEIQEKQKAWEAQQFRVREAAAPEQQEREKADVDAAAARSQDAPAIAEASVVSSRKASSEQARASSGPSKH